MSDGYPISRAAMPIVEMRLRGMGDVVTHATMLHAQELGEAAEAAVKEAIRTFDWRARIGAEVEAAVLRQIKSGIDRFLWSNEGTEMIDDAISRAVKAAFQAPEQAG